MSLLWRDQLRFALCPDRVIFTRISRGLRPRVVDKQIECFSPVSGEAAWKPALEAVQFILEEQSGKPSADALLILSNHFVRYAVVPWSKDPVSEEEEMALVRYRFSQVFGDLSAHWTLRVSDAEFGSSRLAAAVDQELLDEAGKLFAGSRIHLRSVQPYLMATFNQWRSSLSNGWFLLAEPGRLSLALLQQGSWTLVRNRNIGEMIAAELPLILDQERLLCGVADSPKQLLLHMPSESAFKLPEDSDWSVSELRIPPRSGFSPYTDAQYSMAMSGSF